MRKHNIVCRFWKMWYKRHLEYFWNYTVKIWTGDASFKKSGLPKTVEEYLQFLVKEHIFLDKRNRRIQEYCLKHNLL